MSLSEFWNSAFLSALARLPAEQAKLEADKAVEVAINHWQEPRQHHLEPVWTKINDVRIDQIKS